MSTYSDLAADLGRQQHAAAVAWLKFTVEKWQANLRRLKVGSSGELMSSFREQVVGAAGGDELRLRLAYAIQGMYVDMGVGRGMGAGVRKGQGADYNRLRNGRGQLLRHERKAKRWMSKQLRREQHRLSEIQSAITGSILLASIELNVPSKAVEINL